MSVPTPAGIIAMRPYSDAELPEISPFSQESPAARDARLAGAVAKGSFGPIVNRHDAVTALLHDRRLRGPGMDLARMSGIPEGSRT